MSGGKTVMDMDRRIVIQNYTTASDYGSEVKTYATWQTVWAQYRPTSASEAQQADKETAATVKTYYIRYLADILKDYRVIDEYSNECDIIGVEEIERRRYIRLTVKIRE